MFFPIFDLKPRQFQEPAAPSGPVDTPAEAAAEAEPLRSPKAEWNVCGSTTGKAVAFWDFRWDFPAKIGHRISKGI
jgi:hypothetical protein